MADFFDDIPEPGAPAPPPKPTPKRGRRRRADPAPPSEKSVALDAMPATFEEALQQLSDEERGFVKSYIADPTKGAARAYAAAFPSSRSARSRGPTLLDHPRVAIAIKLGREEVAHAVAEATKFGRQAAFEELGTLMDAAKASGQYTGAVRASELRARITGTLVDRSEIRSEAFNLSLNLPTTCPNCGHVMGAPEQSTAPVINVTPSDTKQEDTDDE